MKYITYSIKTIIVLFVLFILSVCGVACTEETQSPQEFTVNYYAGTGGEVIGETEQWLEEGAEGLPVTAIPYEGYRFVVWSDGVETATRTDKNITDNITVTAEFERITYTIFYAVDGSGTIEGETFQSVEYGNNATTVTAVPNEGYEFVAWSDGVTMSTRTDTNVTADITVTATFRKIMLQVSYETDGNGTIEGEISQSVEYDGSSKTVTAVPNEGYEFVAWSDGVETATRTDKNITTNISVTAMFRKIILQVSYETDGNGTITGETSQSVKYGGSATSITAVPNEGYEFVAWSDGVETALRTDDNVKSDVTVTATFRKIMLQVSYETDGNGTITGEACQRVEYGGSSKTVTAVPNEGYEFVTWSDGVEIATRQDDNVKSDILVTATFRKITLQVSYETDGNGTITGEASQSVEYGNNATTVTAVPNEGYEFVAWSDGVETATRTDGNVTADITVTAIFQKIMFTVRYETDNYIYGTLIEDGAKYDTIWLEYKVAYGEAAPIVNAYPNHNQLGEAFVFIYWSDGVTTEERQDANIKADITITAYFGYKLEYRVNGNIGGRIEGNAEQKLLPDGKTEQVTAVPYEGYVFCGWSDLSWETSRSGDSAVLDYLLNYSAVWEYIAYFEPIEKTLNYNYGIASGTPLATQITLNRNDIGAAKFTVPEHEGYTFCGWYADSDYRIRITTENGRYMYGYAAFSLETDTLFAKWQKVGEETDNHKILLVFVDEVQTELYSTVIGQTISIHSKMPAIDYEMGKWIAETIYNLLNEWFAGEVVFEVDCYFTTEIVTDGFSSGLTSFGMIDYCLYADGILEISSTLAYDYHNTITITGINDYDCNLIAGNGTAGIKNAAVYREIFFACATADLYQKFLADCKNGKIDLNDTPVETCLHELTHTAEMYYEEGQYHCLHKAISYAIDKYGYTNIINTIKPCLLGEFEMEGEMCGVPMEYWKHQILIPVGYVDSPVDQRTVGKIIVVGEEEDPDRLPWETGVGSYIVYGSDFSVEAVPNDGYRFVRWSDGITTAIRHDVNIIAYFRVEAIFEKI